ncbi:MAG: hypothetical protein CSA76_03125 [Spirochaetales bacterium]|nr:MAG: hypothetical protein CSA76_03125 [Spirochaetales bacterium]
MKMQLLTPKDMLRHNAHLVLRLLRYNAELSRSEIARMTGSSRSTISHIMQYLEEKKLVVPCGIGNKGVGRSSTLFRFNPEARYGVGIDITKDGISGIMADLQGTIIAHKKYGIGEFSPESVARQIRHIYSSLCGQVSIPQEFIVGIGVMVPGPVDSEGTVIRSVELSWQGPVNLEQLIEESAVNQTQLPPLSIINNANAKALAEACFNINNDSANIVYIENHKGLGAGFVDSHYTLLYGSSGIAMEVGKMFVHNNGVFTQADSFLVINDESVVKQLKKGFQSENPLQDEDVRLISDILAQVISQIAALFNPRKVILDVPYIQNEQSLKFIKKALLKYVNSSSLIPSPLVELPSVQRAHSALGGIAQAILHSPFDFVLKSTLSDL